MTLDADQATTDDRAVSASSGHPTAPRSRGRSVVALLSTGGGPIVLLVLFVSFSIALPSTFLTQANLQSMVSAQAVPGILALGLLLPLAAGEFDFSGGAIASAGAVAVVVLTGEQGVAWPVAAVMVIVGAGLVGAVNGFLVAVLQYGSFVATLAMAGVIAGLTLLQSKGLTLYDGIPAGFTQLGQKKIAGIPLPALALLVIFLLVGYTLRQTAWGRYHDAIGKGRAAVQLAGVSVRSHVFASFVGSACLAGFAGLVLVARLGSAPANVGQAFTLSAFAAAFLGATMMRPGFFNASGTLVAILLIAVGINGLALAGVPSAIEQIFTGGVLLIAVGLSRLEGSRTR